VILRKHALHPEIGVPATPRSPSGRGRGCVPTHLSKFDGETLPDFIDPLFQRIKSGVNGAIVKVKDIAARESRENPVVALHVDQYLLDRVPHGGNGAQQNVHRFPRRR
jgi:hypothetical protein